MTWHRLTHGSTFGNKTRNQNTTYSWEDDQSLTFDDSLVIV